MSSHVPVAVIGAGQAGLSVSWYLGRAGVDHVVLEAKTPVHAWADSRWDNFTLVTPNWHCRLPGYNYQGPDPDGFMTRDEVVGWLAGWLDTFDAPVRTHTRVTRLRNRADDGFELTIETASGEDTLTCDTPSSRRAATRYRSPRRSPARSTPRSPRFTPSNTATPPSFPRVPCWSSAPGSPARRSPRTCTSRGVRCTWPSGALRASRGSTAAATA